MKTQDLIQNFPMKRIKPVDGMAVTAEVWDAAHEYHRQNSRFQTLLFHGWGIVSGLEVLASDPPDTSVYILPGIAIDPAGRTIILPQPVSYDIGNDMEGQLYLLLSYGESSSGATSAEYQPGMPTYSQAEFSLAARASIPAAPCIELGRVLRRSRKDIFRDAVNPAQPGFNEIDLRFRRELRGAQELEAAVCYLGNGEKRHGRGLVLLAQTLTATGLANLQVRDDVLLVPGVEANDLIYLVGEGKFELAAGVANGLANFVTRGRGTLLIEAVDPAAAESFSSLLNGFKGALTPLTLGHPLLTRPNVFALPPAGYDPSQPPEVQAGDGIIFSRANYGLLWQGLSASGSPGRELIRAAVEWGQNLAAYAASRRR